MSYLGLELDFKRDERNQTSWYTFNDTLWCTNVPLIAIFLLENRIKTEKKNLTALSHFDGIRNWHLFLRQSKQQKQQQQKRANRFFLKTGNHRLTVSGGRYWHVRLWNFDWKKIYREIRKAIKKTQNAKFVWVFRNGVAHAAGFSCT